MGRIDHSERRAELDWRYLLHLRRLDVLLAHFNTGGVEFIGVLRLLLGGERSEGLLDGIFLAVDEVTGEDDASGAPHRVEALDILLRGLWSFRGVDLEGLFGGRGESRNEKGCEEEECEERFHHVEV